MANYDVIGNTVIVKFGREEKQKAKKAWAEKFLKEHKNIQTVLEKSDGFKGRLRTQKTKYIAGEKTKEVLHKENNCSFRLNVDTCYFSPRLGAERKEISSLVKKGESVLVLFGGVAPFAVVIAKHARPKKVVSVELGRECSMYAKQNARINKVEGLVHIVQGDVKKILPKMKEKFDRIIMARPQLKDTFLAPTLKTIKKSGTISYYGFYPLEEKRRMIEEIKAECAKEKKKIKILKTKKAGEIGYKKFRWRVDFKVLN